MADGKRMGKEELKALVAREIALAKSDREEASKKITRALEYYQGEMKDLPAEEGRSRAVSRDVADTMGWMLPGIIRVFTASEHMAVAEPVGVEDVHWADQATDGINHIFWKENDGYRIVHAATWDSLLGGNGVVKSWYDDTPQHQVSFHSGLDEQSFVELTADDDVEVLEHTEEMQKGIDPVTGMEMDVPVHAVKIKRLKRSGCTRVEAIPPEDYGKDSDSKTCDEARFQYHRIEKTRSDLVEMGFDKNTVASLSKSSENQTSENIARDEKLRTEDGDPSMDIIDLYECFIRVDINDDGIAETCRVYYAGNKDGGELLDWEEWEDETPFDDIPCDPMPHRWEARSVADETMDVQQIKTALLRQGLDNTYATNNPQRFVEGELLNPEELFSPGFGGAIFGKVGAKVTPLVVPFVANHAYDALNYQDQVIERRTGVSRQTMALDPDALQNQTATANQNARDAAYSQIELVARNQAELGWKKVFRKILRLEIKHQDRPRTIRMRGKFVEIDPHHWNADMDISINVGLGTGSRDRDMMMLREVQMDQMGMTERLYAAGFEEKALEMVPYLATTLVKKAEAAGIRSPELFYPEVTPDDIKAGKRIIAEKKKQPPLEVTLEQMKVQATAQTEELKAKGNAAKEQLQLEADMQTGQMDRETQLVLEQQRQQIEREKIASNERIKIAELAQQRELEILKLNAVEVTEEETGPDGKPTGKGKSKRRIVDNNTALMDGMNRLGEIMAAMSAQMSAPVEIVRGPDGKAMGTRRVVN